MTAVTNTSNPTWMRSRLALVESSLRRVLMALPNQTQYPSALLDAATEESSALLFGEQPETRPHGGTGDRKCGCDECEAWDWADAVETRRFLASQRTER